MRALLLRLGLAISLAATLVTLPATAALGEWGDPDADADGIADPVDNCPYNYNPEQRDWNGDGRGDSCQDSDGDGLTDASELSAGTKPDDKDTDDDGLNDPNEYQRGTSPVNPDSDNDGKLDGADECPTYPGPRNSEGRCAPEPEEPPGPTAPVEEVIAYAEDQIETIVGELPDEEPDTGMAERMRVMATDGVIIDIRYVDRDDMIVQVRRAETGQVVPLNLEPYKFFYDDGRVVFDLFEYDDTPAEPTRLPVRWYYSAATKKLKIRFLLKKVPHTGALLAAVPPVGYPADVNGGYAEGFFNTLKHDAYRDAYDAIPYQVTVG